MAVPPKGRTSYTPGEEQRPSQNYGSDRGDQGSNPCVGMKTGLGKSAESLGAEHRQRLHGAGRVWPQKLAASLGLYPRTKGTGGNECLAENKQVWNLRWWNFPFFFD